MALYCAGSPAQYNAGKGDSLVKKKLRKSLPLYFLLLPAIVYIFIFNYKPMYGVQIAFRNFSAKRGIWGSEWVGLKYFVKFITYPKFTELLGNTLLIGLYGLAVFPCPIIYALMLNEVKNTKFKKTVQMVSYLPHFLSTVVVCSMITLFFHLQSGVINRVIEWMGGTAQDFMTIPEYFPHIYTWSGVWQQIGWNSIIYVAALAGVSGELMDAAKVDGANRFQVIWHINVPSILPTIAITLIMACGSILSVGFEKVFLLQNSLNLSASQVIATYEYEIGLLGGQFSYSAAIGLFNNIVNITLLVIVNYLSKKMSGTSIF